MMRIGVGGITGRMGALLAELTAADADLELAAGFSRSTGALAALEASDVVIDFSTAAASAELAKKAAARGGPPLVLGATGYSAQEEAAIVAAAERVAIVKSGNFSLGVAVLAALVEQAARALTAPAWDIEVLEAHHRGKRDAPSGTALMLGKAAGREAGFASIRAGGLVGEHSVLFVGEDEVVSLAHSARDRRLFARGALAAARWVVARPPGLYAMADVLGRRS